MDITKLFEFIKSLLESGNAGWLVIFILIAIAVNIKHFKLYLESWEFKKQLATKRLAEASQYKQLDANIKTFVKNEIQYEYFLYISGISTGKPLRDKLLQIHKDSGYAIPFRHYRKAFYYLRLDNGVLSIKRTWWQTFEYAFNWFVAGSSIILAILVLFIVAITYPQSNAFIGYFFLFILFAFIFLYQNTPWFSTNRVQEVLDKINQTPLGDTEESKYPVLEDT